MKIPSDILLHPSRRYGLRRRLRQHVSRIRPKISETEKQKTHDSINRIRRQLYNLGLEETAYQDLTRAYTYPKHWFEKSLAAFELAVWHADKCTNTDAQLCLNFLQTVFYYEQDSARIEHALVLQTESLVRLGKASAAKQSVERYLNGGSKTPDLYLALANTETKISKKLMWLNTMFAMQNLEPVIITGNSAPYDSLAVQNVSARTKKGQPLVSVIIPVCNAAKTMQTALQAITQQTWQNLEIIVVDDASTDQTLSLIKKFQQKDSRIRIIQIEQNSGTFPARNAGLQAAKGQFVTCADADDWSHPEKIERQVTDLLEHPNRIGNISQCTRAFETMQFYRRGNPGFYIQPCISSLMFRKKEAVEKIGFWDSIRFGADSEFLERLWQAFGHEQIPVLENTVFSILRQDSTSLTGNAHFGYHGFFAGIRKEYYEAQKYYHEHTALLKYPAIMETRPFVIPLPLQPKYDKTKNNPQRLAIVIAADFREGSRSLPTILQFIHSQPSDVSIGLVQMYEHNKLVAAETAAEVRSILSDSVGFLVYGENITCDELHVFNPALLANKQKYLPSVHAQQGYTKLGSKSDSLFAHKIFKADTWKNV